MCAAAPVARTSRETARAGAAQPRGTFGAATHSGTPWIAQGQTACYLLGTHVGKTRGVFIASGRRWSVDVAYVKTLSLAEGARCTPARRTEPIKG